MPIAVESRDACLSMILDHFAGTPATEEAFCLRFQTLPRAPGRAEVRLARVRRLAALPPPLANLPMRSIRMRFMASAAATKKCPFLLRQA